MNPLICLIAYQNSKISPHTSLTKKRTDFSKKLPVEKEKFYLGVYQVKLRLNIATKHAPLEPKNQDLPCESSSQVFVTMFPLLSKNHH